MRFCEWYSYFFSGFFRIIFLCETRWAPIDDRTSRSQKKDQRVKIGGFQQPQGRQMEVLVFFRSENIFGKDPWWFYRGDTQNVGSNCWVQFTKYFLNFLGTPIFFRISFDFFLAWEYARGRRRFHGHFWWRCCNHRGSERRDGRSHRGMAAGWGDPNLAPGSPENPILTDFPRLRRPA